jgi:hypothetical protein
MSTAARAKVMMLGDSAGVQAAKPVGPSGSALAEFEQIYRGNLVVTAFAAIGLIVAFARWRADPGSRALVVALASGLLLSFGRTTFGSLVAVIPGSGDIFFRRFMMGVQLAALLLAGRGAGWCAGWAWNELDRLIALIRANGGGRVYAGMPSNWGIDFTVGAVAVFKYLESADVDEVGYTLRTASLMTGPEDHFDEVDPSDYELFGIRYLILPSGSAPPVSADEVAVAGPCALWTTSNTGYIHVGTIAGTLTADRTDLGARSVRVLRSGLAESGDYLKIHFGGRQATLPPLPRPSRQPAAGNVTSEIDDLEHGTVSATVTMRRPGVVVLSTSFDDGWNATVDGRRQPTAMASPALVATNVPAGTHGISFRYRGYSGYAELFALTALTLAAFAGADAIRGRRGGPAAS